MSKPLYSLDASGLITGWFTYPPDYFPKLWENMERLILEKRLLIAEDVYVELKTKDEALIEWVKTLKAVVVPLDEEQQNYLSHILEHYPNFVNVLTGKSQGDPFVVALAKMRGAKVITAEKPTGNLNGPRIPDVCKAEGVVWGNFLEIIKDEGWSF